MTATQAFTLAAVVGGFFLTMFLLKKGALAFFGMQIKHQVGALACVSALIALIFPSSFIPAFLITGTVIFSFWGWLMKKAGGFSRRNADTVVRGNRLVDRKVVQNMVKGEDYTVTIGGVNIPRRLEVSHFLLAGTTRTGKSQALLGMMSAIRQRGEKCLVADVGGEFTARFYREGIDKSLNPFDVRGISWSPLCEMASAWDAEKVAKSIIPDGHGSEEQWNGYAQTLVAAVLLRVWESDGNNREVLRLLTRASQAELKQYVAGLPAEGLFAEGAERMLASITGIVSSYIKPLQYLDPETGVDGFSIRGWVEEGDKPGAVDSWLFFNFTDSQFASLRPIIAASLDVAISAVLDLMPNPARVAKGLPERRVWMMLDELATFGHLGSLVAMLEKGAKYGAPVVAGLQAPLAQLRQHYGPDVAQTLLANLGTQLVLRSPDAESAEYLSRLFSEQQIPQIAYGTSNNGSDVTHTQNVQLATQRVVMPAEIMGLANLTGYLNVVGDIPPCPVQIQIVHGEEVAERFVPKARTKAKVEEAVAA